MGKCSLCSKPSKIADISKAKLCMPCICDFTEGVEKVPEDIEETIDNIGLCLNCNRFKVLYKGKICWECYKRAADDFQRDEDRQDYNCRL